MIVIRPLVIGTVEMVVVTVATHLLVITPSALISTIMDFSRTCNVMRASGLDMLPLTVICWLWCFLDKHVKQSLSDEDKRKVESNWLRMYKEKLGQPQRPPSQVMKA